MEVRYLWEWFVELHMGRGNSGWGPHPISYSDMAAWAQLMGHALTMFEVSTLRLLDAAYMGYKPKKNG